MSSSIDALYQGVAILWVEDPETKAWLQRVWQRWPSVLRIEIMVAGGRGNVDALCQDAVARGFNNVFGLVDRDFGNTNYPRWSNLNNHQRVHRLNVHEIENLFFDSTALHGCVANTARRSAPEIDARLQIEAQKRAWWVACCHFLATTRPKTTAGWPKNPPMIQSLSDAEAYVCNADWFKTTAHGCPTLAAQAAISTQLQAHYANATNELSNGQWKSTFPGKQIFHDIANYVHTKTLGAPNPSLDLVKALGDWQLNNHRIPSQAMELQAHILRRYRP